MQPAAPTIGRDEDIGYELEGFLILTYGFVSLHLKSQCEHRELGLRCLIKQARNLPSSRALANPHLSFGYYVMLVGGHGTVGNQSQSSYVSVETGLHRSQVKLPSTPSAC
jgi:hypothetical protein